MDLEVSVEQLNDLFEIGHPQEGMPARPRQVLRLGAGWSSHA